MAAPVYRTPKGYEDREERLPLRGLRRAISQQMWASHLYTVRTLSVDEADLTELVALRQRLKPTAESRGVKLSYLPFIFKAIVRGLQKYPALNTSFDEVSSRWAARFRNWPKRPVRVASIRGIWAAAVLA